MICNLKQNTHHHIRIEDRSLILGVGFANFPDVLLQTATAVCRICDLRRSFVIAIRQLHYFRAVCRLALPNIGFSSVGFFKIEDF
jgi:hypothetical protein